MKSASNWRLSSFSSLHSSSASSAVMPSITEAESPAPFLTSPLGHARLRLGSATTFSGYGVWVVTIPRSSPAQAS